MMYAADPGRLNWRGLWTVRLHVDSTPRQSSSRVKVNHSKEAA